MQQGSYLSWKKKQKAKEICNFVLYIRKWMNEIFEDLKNKWLQD